MAVADNLGTRMKEYEKRNQYYLQKRTPVVIRVDMRAGHTFTRGFERPFDNLFMSAMQKTMKYMCENIQGATLGYCQSDEITIVLIDYWTLETDSWFNYRTDKLCSIAASMATFAFNKYFASMVKDNKPIWCDNEESKLYIAYNIAIKNGAMFDARCFNIPKEEVTNLIYWLQLDATRNSIQMVGQANFSHKELLGKSCNMIQDMLMTQKYINWNDFPIAQKRGTCCIKISGGWAIDKGIPIFKGEDRNYIESRIYVG